MCFSAPASFTAAICLGVLGCYLTQKFKRDKKIFLALIPCFFAIQQFFEGVLWIALTHNYYPDASWSLFAQYAFLFFAFIVWPIWIPFSLFYAEVVSWRRSIFLTIFVSSLAFLLYHLSLVYSDTVRAKVIEKSITYSANSSEWVKGMYLLLVVFPFFISSIPKMWSLGVLVFVSWLISDYFYSQMFTSVWCFASAIIFMGLLLVLKKSPEEIS